MAGLDGIENRVDPTSAGYGPYEENFNLQDVVDKYRLPSAPNSLEEALAALEKDHEFLARDNVVPEGLIKAWIKVKETLEIAPLKIRRIVENIKKYKVRVVFAEPQLSSRVAEVIAREAGVKVLMLDPLGGRPPYGDDYLRMMRHNLSMLEQAMQ